MSAWRIKRQITIIVIVFLAIATPIALWAFLHRPEPSCFDGKQNQGELGIDCGGGCQAVCAEEVSDLQVLWSRAFEVRPGQYDLAVLVENSNLGFAAENFSYRFEIFDTQSSLVHTEEGVANANPREQFIIFKPNVSIGNVPISEVFFEVTGIEWKRIANFQRQQISVSDEVLTIKPTTRLSATLINNNPEDIQNVEAIATIFNDEENIVALSSTFVDSIPASGAQRVFFTWPDALPEAPSVCINPVEAMLVFDRSGSMNDDGVDPPQPLADAQIAAQSFVKQLSSRDKVGLVSFATEATTPIDQGLTNNTQKVFEKINAVSVLPEEETGLTNLGSGIQEAFTELRDIGDSSKKQVLIVLTDGKTNAPEGLGGGETFAEDAAEDAKKSDVEIYAIGLGSNINESFLEDSIASTPDNYFFSATSGELEGIYSQIAEDVCPEKIFLTNIFVRSIDAVR